MVNVPRVITEKELRQCLNDFGPIELSSYSELITSNSFKMVFFNFRDTKINAELIKIGFISFDS